MECILTMKSETVLITNCINSTTMAIVVGFTRICLSALSVCLVCLDRCGQWLNSSFIVGESNYRIWWGCKWLEPSIHADRHSDC